MKSLGGQVHLLWRLARHLLLFLLIHGSLGELHRQGLALGRQLPALGRERLHRLPHPLLVSDGRRPGLGGERPQSAGHGTKDALHLACPVTGTAQQITGTGNPRCWLLAIGRGTVSKHTKAFRNLSVHQLTRSEGAGEERHLRAA